MISKAYHSKWESGQLAKVVITVDLPVPTIHFNSSKSASNKKVIVVNERDRLAFDWHTYASIKHKFIFFTIPKIASTTWMQLVFRMEGDESWYREPHFRNDRPLLKNYSCAEITSFLNDPSWTKAVFFRDPAERLLSAYLNKIYDDKEIVRRLFDRSPGEVTFHQFVYFVTRDDPRSSKFKGLNRNTNQHWKPQYMVSNIKKFRPCLSFIGDFSRLALDGKSLLSGLGLWNRYGKSGWGKNMNESIFNHSMIQNKKDAKSEMKNYYSEELLARVRNAYRLDYEFLMELGLHY